MSHLLRDQRCARVRHAMAQTGLDLLVVVGDAWRSDYLRFVVDVTPMEGVAMVALGRTGPNCVWVQHPAEAARWQQALPTAVVVCVADPAGAVLAHLAQVPASAVGLAPSQVAPLSLAAGTLGKTLAACTAMLDALMVNKSPEEADALARSVRLADEGYAVFKQAARVGRREFELVADVEAWFRSQGCPENFMILGSGGPELRSMHPAGERRLAPGDLVTTELTPCADGYYTQICRTLVMGEPSQAQRDAFAVYRQALEAGIAVVRPGATHGDVAKAQNDVFRKHGLGDYVTSQYTRVRGHGLGLFVDGPHVLEGVPLVLEENMTLVVHPNTYHPVAGYIVLGDTVRVTATGCEVLTTTPRELFSVPL